MKIRTLIQRSILFLTILFIMGGFSMAMAQSDDEAISRQSQTIRDDNGEVTVTLEWLRRPGEFALTIDYWGYLTQEGRVNAYLSVNGVQREFVTLQDEQPNRHQRIRLVSFHPTAATGKSPRMRPLNPGEVVDYQLFRNAPYYSQFGKVIIELKFFADGRWDGDGNRNDENFHITFSSPVKDFPPDHF